MRPAILPDWWAESCERDPALLSDLEVRVARFLGQPVSAIRDPAIALATPSYSGAQLRRVRDLNRDRLAPAIHAAMQVAAAVVRSLRATVPVADPPSPDGLRWREGILRAGAAIKLDEIAAAFLAKEEAVRTRLLRAKRKIRGAGIPTGLPNPHQIESRLEQVLAAIYLIFNEGYLATRGDVAGRTSLTSEAIRLGSHLVDLVPHCSEAHSLLALMLLTDARAVARAATPGVLIPLDEQDRSLWSREKIVAGRGHLTTALKLERPARYGLQAAISAEHCRAGRAEDTDWTAIVKFYDHLLNSENSAVYRLNRCVALSFAESPLAALEDLAELEREGELGEHYLLWATRGDLLRKTGRSSEALRAFRHAMEHVENTAVRAFLGRRINELQLAENQTS